MSLYKDLGAQIASAAGWKESWLPRKLDTIGHDLSAQVHSSKHWKEKVQRGNTSSVVLSAKVLPSKCFGQILFVAWKASVVSMRFARNVMNVCLSFLSLLPVEACKALEVLFAHFDIPIELDTQEGWIDRAEDSGMNV